MTGQRLAAIIRAAAYLALFLAMLAFMGAVVDPLTIAGDRP